MSYYKSKPKELLSGFEIADQPAEWVAEEAAYKATVELGREDLIPDITQELLIEIFTADGNGNPIRTKGLLVKRAKSILSKMTEQINPGLHTVPSDVPKALVANHPKVVQEALDDLKNPKQQMYFEALLNGEDELEANLASWPAKPGANPESEKNRIRRNRADANTALAKAANRRASRGSFVSYDALVDDIISGVADESMFVPAETYSSGFRFEDFEDESDSTVKAVEAIEPVSPGLANPVLDSRFWEAYTSIDEAIEKARGLAESNDRKILETV